MGATLYVRISNDTKAWLDELAAESGLSVAKVSETLLSDCRERGVKVSMQVNYEVSTVTERITS